MMDQTSSNPLAAFQAVGKDYQGRFWMRPEAASSPIAFRLWAEDVLIHRANLQWDSVRDSDCGSRLDRLARRK